MVMGLVHPRAQCTAWLAHFRTKCLEEFEAKTAREFADSKSRKRPNTQLVFENITRTATVAEPRVYVALLRALGVTGSPDVTLQQLDACALRDRSGLLSLEKGGFGRACRDTFGKEGAPCLRSGLKGGGGGGHVPVAVGRDSS
jgi:hypothetical protein